MMSVESASAIAMAVNPLPRQFNSALSSPPLRVRKIPSVLCPPAQGSLLWALRRGTDPGEERGDSIPVMFWQNGFDDADRMMDGPHPLTATLPWTSAPRQTE
jgi:hypothetical protein